MTLKGFISLSETTSDQSDIEGRIRALKDELRKRKSVVDQLKKEQKKRQGWGAEAQRKLVIPICKYAPKEAQQQPWRQKYKPQALYHHPLF